jgi:hypothetical protein
MKKMSSQLRISSKLCIPNQGKHLIIFSEPNVIFSVLELPKPLDALGLDYHRYGGCILSVEISSILAYN